MFDGIAYVSATAGDLYTGCLSHQNAKQQDPSIMITAADEITIDFRTSCTKDEAAAKLLGWMRDSVRRKYIHLTASGISADQLPHLHTLEGSLADHLLELREDAYIELKKAFDADAAPDIMEQKESVVTRWGNEIEKAAKYLCDIDDELSKGKESALKIDKKASKKAGTPQILISSLDRWAQKEYKIFIFATDPDEPTSGATPVQVESKDDESSAKGGLNKEKADYLYTMFAFLVEAFSNTIQAYAKGDNPNYFAIAKRIEKDAMAAYKGDALDGLSKENIRKYIAEAIKRKKAALSK